MNFAEDLRKIPSCEGQTFTVHQAFIEKRRFIPSYEGQTSKTVSIFIKTLCDSSPHARGRLHYVTRLNYTFRFIPSCEGQTSFCRCVWLLSSIHPLMRGADSVVNLAIVFTSDSSPHARGRPSVSMRLSAALNTSLCNLHKCHFRLTVCYRLYI